MFVWYSDPIRALYVNASGYQPSRRLDKRSICGRTDSSKLHERWKRSRKVDTVRSRWNRLASNVFDRQVHGRHGRAGSKLLFLLGILMCFHIVILVCSYRGYYCGLSIHLRGFDSPTDRQVLRVTSPEYLLLLGALGPATVALPYLLDSSIG